MHVRLRLAAAALAMVLAASAQAGPATTSVEHWRAELSSPDPVARVAAARGLALSGNQAGSAVPDLVAALGDESRDVRAAVVDALAEIGAAASEQAARPLALRIQVEPDPDILQAIARTLIRFGSGTHHALPSVLDALHAPNPVGRRMACTVLGGLGVDDLHVVHALVASMLEDTDPRVRNSAHRALEKLRVNLVDHADDIVAALGHESPDVRDHAAERLGEMRPRPLHAVVPLAQALLNDESLRVRESAARALRNIGTEASAAIPELLTAMHAGSRDQREAASSVLGSVSLGDRDDIDALVRTSTSDSELSVRLAARGSLVRMARTSPAIFDRYAEAAASPGPVARRVALIDALGRLGEAAAPAVPALLVALREGTAEVREEAARSLGRIGADAADALLPLRRVAAWDRSQGVRDAAEQAIKSIRRSLERRGEAAPAAGPDLEAPDMAPGSGGE